VLLEKEYFCLSFYDIVVIITSFFLNKKLIIYDFSRGGSGFGICNDLVNCVIPVTEGPRLLILLISSFFVLVFFLRLIMKFINTINEEKSIL